MIFLLFPGSAAEQARNGLFVQLGADDDQLAAHIGTAGADLPLAGHIVELQPAVGAAVHDALGTQDHAVLAGIQLREGVLDIRLGDLLGGLDAPAGEDLVGVVAVVVMMVVMAAAAMFLVVMILIVIMVVLMLVVVIEYNGMWLLQDLANNLPENWIVYQCIATADGTTALTYARDNAMRSLLLDKIARSELIVFNRAEAVNNDAARQELHKLVRQASRKCDIAYEFADGSVAYDDIPDPLPFDLNKPVVEIGDDDFGIWYMDCQDEPQKYAGKTVKFLAQVCQTNRAGKNSFVPGRFAMTCCVQDIQFVGFPCSYDGYKALEQRAWVTVTAKVNYKFHNIYRGKGPVLTAISVESAEKPLNDVVTFS